MVFVTYSFYTICAKIQPARLVKATGGGPIFFYKQLSSKRRTIISYFNHFD